VLPSSPVPDAPRPCSRARARTTALLAPALAALLAAGQLPLAAPALADAPALERVSVAGGPVPVRDSTGQSSLSRDGRYVAFVSAAPVLPGDTNGVNDVFRRDRVTGAVVRLSGTPGGAAGSADSHSPSISGDGNLIAFVSSAPDLVAGDTNGQEDVFVRDVAAGTTRRVSVSTAGAQTARESGDPAISADGTTVAFTSRGPDLVPGDTNGVSDVFVHVLAPATTERVSVSSTGGQGLGEPSTEPSLSDDGNEVVFLSAAEGLTTDPRPPAESRTVDVYHRDRAGAVTRRISRGPGEPGVQDSTAAVLSGDGRVVAFTDRDLLSPEDDNSLHDVYAYDVATGTRTLVSVGATSGTSSAPAIDGDGSTVLFVSDGDVGTPNPGMRQQVYRRDLPGGAVQRLSVTPAGAPGRLDSGEPAISGDGRVVAFSSRAVDVLADDLNGEESDVLVREGGTTSRVVDLRPDPDPEAAGGSYEADATPDGRYVAFTSYAGDLAPGVARGSGNDQVYLRDRVAGSTVLVSTNPSGKAVDGNSDDPSVSADGRYVAFTSDAADVVPGDTNDDLDVFVRDVVAGTTAPRVGLERRDAGGVLQLGPLAQRRRPARGLRLPRAGTRHGRHQPHRRHLPARPRHRQHHQGVVGARRRGRQRPQRPAVPER
jgi:Tol biopolymer transport system component